MHAIDPGPGLALQREAQAWLLRLTSGQATAGDADAFRRWRAQSAAHAQAFAESRLLWDHLGQALVLAGQARPAAAGARRRRMSRRAFLGGALAASAYLAIRPPFGLWPAWSDLAADYRTATGEQRQLELGPGISVAMNTQTALNLRTLGDGSMRMDLLTGEAQILIAGRLARPFAAYAGGGRLLAQAASQCNLRCLDGQASVTCINGSARLDYAGHDAVLGPDQQIGYGARGLGAITAADPEIAMAWRRRVLIFEHRPLSEVVAEINRYRPGKLIITNTALAARTVQARFTLSQLADVAALIHDAYGATLTTLPGGIVLLG